MSIKSQSKINTEADIEAFRRKIYYFLQAITRNDLTSSNITSDISEVLKRSLKINSFVSETCFDRNRVEDLLEVSLIFFDQGFSPPDFFYAHGFHIHSEGHSGAAVKLTKAYHLSHYSTELPNDDELKSLLDSKSQDELFAEIAAQQAALQSILDNSPISIGFRVGPTYLYTNKMYQSAFGINAGDTISDIYADPVQRDLLQAQLTKDGFLRNAEAVFKRRDGALRQSEFSILPMEFLGQKGYMVWINDVTEKKLAEEAILKAKAAAEDATKTKSDFLANMSHEIRTPMNAIIGMSHLALRGNLEKRERNYIEKVHRAGESLLGIINDILDFSKIEAGKMSMEEIDFSLPEVMDNLANLIGIKIEEKGLELLFDISHEVPDDLIGDPLRLGQVLINLVSNAVKFTEKGQIVVSVKKISEDSNGVCLGFAVQDSGIGMSEEQCSRMFQSFSQADTSTTRKYGGTGLGLAISKNLVELMDGRIWVESKVGEGSTFQFDAKFKKQLNPASKRAFDIQKLKGKRGLIADDNWHAREILATLAQDLGLTVDKVTNGDEAVTAVKRAIPNAPYDVVFLDWQMPVLNGLDAAKTILTFDNAPEIVIITSFSREEVFDEMTKRGFHVGKIITKPASKKRLVETLQELGMTGSGRNYKDSGNLSSDQLSDDLRNLKVLLVEDNELNQELALELLGSAGLSVTLAKNGQEALDVLKIDPTFECVLMDCQMPVMDGYTATREIRKMPEFVKLPIIAMTANTMAGDREKAIEAGMWDHIPKPLNVNTMFATIAKWVMPSRSVNLMESDSQAINSEKIQDIRSSLGLDKLHGVDVEIGLKNTMNNEALFRKILGMFYDTQKNFLENFTLALADKDPDAAMRCAHTLKGNAGNIGAKEIHKAAGELEEACKNKAESQKIESLVTVVIQKLAPTIKSLAELNEERTNETTATKSIDEDELKNKIKVLSKLLEDSDASAADFVNTILDEVQNGPVASDLKQVSKRIDEFDFDAALTKLAEIKI